MPRRCTTWRTARPGSALVFAGAIGAYGYGLAADEDAIARVLDGVYLDAGIALDLDLSPQAKDAARSCSPHW